MIHFGKTKQLIGFMWLGLSAVSFSQNKLDSLDIKIGQMILVGVPSTQVDSITWRVIRQGKIGGLILFEKNISIDNSYTNLKKMIWTYKKETSIPLIVAIDQEGGKVNRLKEKYNFPKSISAANMGKSLDSVRFYGESTGGILASLGINLNLAPVIDLSINPSNPVIAKMGRAFSSNEDSVAHYAKEFIQAHHRMNVATMLKHFPGHGSSDTDTHLGLVDVTKRWIPKELKPYKILIEEGYVDAIMTAHIVNKKLDNLGLPCTLSKSMVDGLLRKKLGYKGVIISDDMQMHAITKYFSFKKAIQLAINAGIDMLIFSNNIQNSKEHTADKVHATIRTLVAEGVIDKERINQSFKRIIILKKRWVQDIMINHN